jgi:hypothetical protein
MFITRLLARIKYWWFRNNVSDEFYYTPSVSTCLELLDIAATTLLQQCTPRVLMRERVIVTYPTIDSLVLELNRAIVACQRQEPFVHRATYKRAMVDLDNYLLDSNQRPVGVADAKEKIRVALVQLDDVLEKTEDSNMYEYYQRVYSPILVDVITLTEALLDVAILK